MKVEKGTAPEASQKTAGRGEARFGAFEAVPGQIPRYIKPEALVIIGRDTTHQRGEHPLWDMRAMYPAQPGEITGIQAAAEQRRIPVVPVAMLPIPSDKLTPEYVAAVNALCAALDAAKFPAYHAIAAEIKAGKTVSVPVVVDGRQRVISARSANEKNGGAIFMPTVVFTDTGKGDLVTGMIAANAFAKPLDPWEKADLLADFYAHAGKDRQKAAEAFACTTENVRLMERWGTLTDDIRQQVREGKLAYSAAVALAGSSQAEQQAVAASAQGGGDVRENNRKARDAAGGARKPPAKRVENLIKMFRKSGAIPQPVKERLAKANPAVLLEFALGHRDATAVCAGFDEVWEATAAKSKTK